MATFISQNQKKRALLYTLLGVALFPGLTVLASAYGVSENAWGLAMGIAVALWTTFLIIARVLECRGCIVVAFLGGIVLVSAHTQGLSLISGFLAFFASLLGSAYAFVALKE